MAKSFKIQQKRIFEVESEPIQAITLTPCLVAASPVRVENFPELPFAISDILTASEMEEFDERAGIMEFDGGLPTVGAEAAASGEVLNARARGPADLLLHEFDCIEIKGPLYDSLPKFTERDERERNGIKRLPSYFSQTIVREAIPPWDRVSRS